MSRCRPVRYSSQQPPRSAGQCRLMLRSCVGRALLPLVRARGACGAMAPSALLRCAASPRPACVAASRASRLGAWASRPGGACFGVTRALCLRGAERRHVSRAALGRVAVRFASGRTAAPMTLMGKGPKKGKTKDEEASLYKDTVNLPQTSFGAHTTRTAAAAPQPLRAARRCSVLVTGRHHSAQVASASVENGCCAALGRASCGALADACCAFALQTSAQTPKCASRSCSAGGPTSESTSGASPSPATPRRRCSAKRPQPYLCGRAEPLCRPTCSPHSRIAMPQPRGGEHRRAVCAS